MKFISCQCVFNTQLRISVLYIFIFSYNILFERNIFSCFSAHYTNSFVNTCDLVTISWNNFYIKRVICFGNFCSESFRWNCPFTIFFVNHINIFRDVNLFTEKQICIIHDARRDTFPCCSFVKCFYSMVTFEFFFF